MNFPFSLANNGILILYNQFPRCYPGGIKEMTGQLDEIKKMGFNAVWINPIQAVGKKQVMRSYGKKQSQVKGSLYAMFDDTQFNNSFTVTEGLIKAYTAEARRLELVPLFDLVLNQVAADDDSPIVGKFKTALENKPQWDDTKWFKYNSTERQAIINFWKEYIKKYICDYGFMGVRVDAVKFLPTDVQQTIYGYVNECVRTRFGAQFGNNMQAVILGELLDSNPLDHLEKVKNVGLTHINNSMFEADFSFTARKSDKKLGAGWNPEGYYLHEIGKLRAAIRPQGLPSDDIAGGTIGYTGNHDKMSLGQVVRRLNKQSCNKENRNDVWKMKEFIMGVAFSSDAGWYALCGDEFGIERSPPLVFDCFKVENSFHTKWGSEIDLRRFIAGVNHVLSSMPAVQLCDYVEHIVIDGCEELAVIVRHSKPNDNMTTARNLIVINLYSQSPLQLQETKQLLSDHAKLRHIVNQCTIHMIDATKTYVYELGDNQFMEWVAPQFVDNIAGAAHAAVAVPSLAPGL